MFDEVHFTGTINLGNVLNALVFLIGSVALYYRVKAENIKHEQQTGEKLEQTLKKRLTRPKKIKPATGDQGDDPAGSDDANK